MNKIYFPAIPREYRSTYLSNIQIPESPTLKNIVFNPKERTLEALIRWAAEGTRHLSSFSGYCCVAELIIMYGCLVRGSDKEMLGEFYQRGASMRNRREITEAESQITIRCVGFRERSDKVLARFEFDIGGGAMTGTISGFLYQKRS